VLESAVFRLARDSELTLDDEGGQSYLDSLEEELRQRRRSAVVRLDVESSISDTLLSVLIDQLHVDLTDVYRVPPPVDMRVLFALADLQGFAHLRQRPAHPVNLLDSRQQTEIFSVLDEHDACSIIRTNRSMPSSRW
jgi:polyphosphate kinase